MNESGAKTSSSLAITEKRTTTTTTHRPGGCVGIFFQLFDWNRRFAKKKLFSKKLLPPVRAKQASKKFKGDEKMPTSKLHLIADENKGGFPNMKKHGNRNVDSEHNNCETRAPGLVARLMGLESMPAIREKPKKVASFSDTCDKGEKSFVNKNNRGGSGREDMRSERACVKFDSRPQKLQKTGQFDRKAVARFGAESALQIKSVLSRSRKHHHHQHPKFVSPVKSPRILSGKNVSRTSRLIDAATKILEPGLQSTSKAKNALTYLSSVHYHHSNGAVKDTTVVKPEEQTKQAGYSSNAAKSLMGQTSCQNCGNLLGVVDCRPNVDEEPSGFPFVSNFVNGSSSEETGRIKPRIPVSSLGQEMEPDFQRNWDQHMSLGTQKKEEIDNVQSNSKPFFERKSRPHESLAPWPSSRQPCTFQSDASTSVNLEQRTQIQEQMPLGRDRTPPRSNSNLNNFESRRISSAANSVRGSKDFVSLNRNLSGQTKPRVPTKVESSNKLVPEKKAFNGRDESLPPLRSSLRKRRTGNVSSKVECGNFVSSTATKPRNIRCDSMKGKEFGLQAHSMNRTCVKSSKLAGPTEGNRVAKSNSNDVISFTFNSPIRKKTGTAMKPEKSMDDEMKSFQKPSSLKGDSIAALLEQKLKELTSQEDDELVMGGPPKRSTAMILQELISALTAERPDIASPSTAKTKHENYAGFSHVADHLSPGSVLEASFSSSSLDGSSGHRLCTDSMDYSCDQLHYSSDQLHYFLGQDADLLDSATSWEKELAGCERMMPLIGNISRILDTLNIAGGRLTGSTLSNAKDVVVNAELLFGDAALHSLDGLEGLYIGPILLELETSANVAWTITSTFSGVDENKGGSQSRGFLFDCLIECLDTNYRKYHFLGFRAWTRLVSFMNRERIIGEVEKEMKKWSSLAGMILDEIVEWEMDHGQGKWTNFDIEAFESSDEVCGDILQALVDETLIDLWECWQGSF